MALDPVQLDTLTWDQMVTAIQTRIFPDSDRQWTLHAPVDPGVTMLELFAWLLDQRIYWMDQVPDALILAILSLLGEAPKPARAAVTVLQLVADSPTSHSNVFSTAPQGMLMRRGDTIPPLIFTLDQSLTVLPVNSITVDVDGVERSADLTQGQPVPLMSPGAGSAIVLITLKLSAPVPASISGGFVSLLLELETPSDVFPQWSWDAAAVAPPATLAFSYAGASGTWLPLQAGQVDDGTAGLRRSGLLRFAIPADWQGQSDRSDSASNSYTIRMLIGNPQFSVVPLLSRIVPNAAVAHHRWLRKKSLANPGWLPIPGNVISLPAVPSDSSLKEYPPLEDRVQLTLQERDPQNPAGKAYRWSAVADLSLSGPADRVFVVERGKSQLRFGDGLTGRLPVPLTTVAAAIQLAYEVGGGADGNVGTDLSWVALPGRDGDPDPGFTAVNVVSGDGGLEAETLDAATQRARAALNERNRAVIRSDYENLARSTPGVAFRRAYAGIGFHSDFPCTTVPGVVTVFVVPYAPRITNDGTIDALAFVAAPQPDSGALQAARTRLDTGRLLGSEIFVMGPVYRPVWVSVIIASDGALPTDFHEQVRRGLQTFLDPLVGGADGLGWPFGDPLRPSALLQVAQDILGPAGDVLSVAISLDAMDTTENCKDVKIESHELVQLRRVDLHTQRRTSSNGGLR
ncbi:hypothetical protein [Paraburkholderia sp. BR14374]|uniref:hypothetical protein n=1 Tax=Paraburkholderia sp. BR14374 TaxID=3237007 RepID=UPI0034CD2D4A